MGSPSNPARAGRSRLWHGAGEAGWGTAYPAADPDAIHEVVRFKSLKRKDSSGREAQVDHSAVFSASRFISRRRWVGSDQALLNTAGSQLP